MRIQHNIPAMSSYRNYSNNTSALAKNLEKLSSGYKINRAGDDAAGLAISEKMRAQITGLEVAQKNAKDGISLVQTAEGALTEVHSMLNRMYELAEQSANGTYADDVDREQLQKEVDQLRTEINRIADSSNFNGIKLLDGSLDGSARTPNATNMAVTVIADGQLGKEAQAGVYSIDFSNVKVTASENNASVEITVFGDKTLSVTLSKSGDELQGAALAEKFKEAWDKDKNSNANGFKDDFGFTMSAKVEGSKLVFTMSNPPTKEFPTAAEGFNKNSANISLTLSDATTNNAAEVTVTVEKEAVDATKSRMYGQAYFTLTNIADGSAITIGDETYVFAVGENSQYKDMANVVDLTDKTASATDLIKVAAQRLSTAAKNNRTFKVGTNLQNGEIVLTEREGAIDYSKNNLAGSDGKGSKGNNNSTTNATADDWAGLVKTGSVSMLGTPLMLQIGDTAETFNQMNVSINDMHATAMGIGDIDISTQDGAAAAMAQIKNAINYVSDTRGTLGATQNRLDHTINNLSVMQENIQDAESTIRDVDIAKEMMEYTKNNILVQSAQAMLAQANQLPQGVLQLLQ